MVKSFDEYVNISEVYFECFAIVQDIDGYYGVIRDKKQDGLRKNNMINNLGEGSIPKLMAKLAIPAVVAQVVNLLYNIVDRIYIGHIPQIGADALTGVGLFTPVLMLLNAFAMLAGSGGAPRAAIYMGKKDNATAEKIVGNCFTFLVICAVVLTAGFYGTLPVLLKWFGASSVTMPYALSYARIYVLGSIFVLIVLGMILPGDSISAQKIALRYNVSRTPAREAIVNLEKEGLLKVIPQSGTYVACINCKRSEQEWFVRKSLEIGMADAIFKNASADMLDKMAELNNRLINYDEETESIPRIEIDNEFHQLIYECSGEQLAKNIIKTQMSHYNRIRYLAELNKNISVKTNDEHNMLIDAIRNKDKRMYLRVIKAHISRIFNELDKLKGIYPEYFEKN